jgi:hypothetical protein
MRLQALIQFIENYCFDEQVYVVVPTADGGEEEVYWRRSAPERPWFVQRRGGDNASIWRYSGVSLIPALERRGADLDALERELRALVSLQVSFADQMLREARRLLGDAEVEASLYSIDELRRSLTDAIRDLHAPRAVETAADDSPTSAPRRGHLRLIARPLDLD